MLRNRLLGSYNTSYLGETAERLQTAVDRSRMVTWLTKETKPKRVTFDLGETAVGKPGIYVLNTVGTLLRQSWTQSTLQRGATAVRRVLLRSPKTVITVVLLAILATGFISSI